MSSATASVKEFEWRAAVAIRNLDSSNCHIHRVVVYAIPVFGRVEQVHSHDLIAAPIAVRPENGA
jgi:hypothetical protein